MRNKKGQFIKGHRASKETEFKKGERLGKDHPNWKGGRRKDVNGYIVINVKGHPKAYRNEVYEHIIVAEKKIGRYLKKGEVVHHINGIKNDNSPENLVVVKTNAGHRIKYHSGNRWSRKHDKCIRCGTNEKKHEGLGLCWSCYKKEKYRRKL